MGEGTDEFWLREETTRKGHSVEWGAFDETLGSRFFDREFLESGEVERFVVTEPGGEQHSFMVWGADGCERCPAGYEFEPLPGDIWGCGTPSEDGADGNQEPSGDGSSASGGGDGDSALTGLDGAIDAQDAK